MWPGRVLILLHAASRSAHAWRTVCSVGRPSDVVCPLNDSSTVEYELRWMHKWQWFVLPTHDAAAVSVGMVMQRGSSKNFPRTGFVVMASPSGVPPGSLQSAEYDPTTYVHDDPVGARRQFIYESPVDGSRPKTDWKVLTLGYDTNRSMDEPQRVQVPLGNVLIGLRCHETTWTWPYYPGCRVSITATLLPFALADNLTIAAPMRPGDSHLFRIDLGDCARARTRRARTRTAPAHPSRHTRMHAPQHATPAVTLDHRHRCHPLARHQPRLRPYPRARLLSPHRCCGADDSLNVSLQRHVSNATHRPAKGLVGAAMLNRELWSRPAPLEIPRNVSLASPGVVLDESPLETSAMLGYIYQQLRADRGLLNLEGCAEGLAGCRKQYFPVATDSLEDPETVRDAMRRGGGGGEWVGGAGGFCWVKGGRGRCWEVLG